MYLAVCVAVTVIAAGVKNVGTGCGGEGEGWSERMGGMIWRHK